LLGEEKITKQKEYDKIAVRLSLILRQLNEGEILEVKSLAEAFNVSVRTIQKDLNERLSFLPFEKERGMYRLPHYCLGQLTLKDIQSFADFSGLKELYPYLNYEMIESILNDKEEKALEIRGYVYENLSSKIEPFNIVVKAILDKNELQFDYGGKARLVKPYKLMNTAGIWYLVGVEGDILKHFSFLKVEKLVMTHRHFIEDDNIVKILLTQKEGWVTQQPKEVILSISKDVADYFLRRNLLPQQKMLEQREEDFLFSCQIAYNDEILRLVRYWIPHLTILSPESLQKQLEDELHGYLCK
jgi:predicted DNA-binding transcriptional regulator YafY